MEEGSVSEGIGDARAFGKSCMVLLTSKAITTGLSALQEIVRPFGSASGCTPDRYASLSAHDVASAREPLKLERNAEADSTEVHRAFVT